MKPRKVSSVLKLLAQNLKDVLDRLVLEVSLLQHLGRGVEHSLGSSETEFLERFYHPSLDFIAELIEIDILLPFLNVAIDIDGVSGQHRGQTDIVASAANGE